MTFAQTNLRRNKTLLVLVACLSGAMFSAYQLYLELNSANARNNGLPIARLQKITANVRRKASTSYVWESGRNDAPLFARDSIQAGPNSSASIELNDGTHVELGENSLVVLDTVKDLALNFMFGSFVLRGASGDRQVEISKDGTTKVTEFEFRLLSPLSHETFFTLDNAPRTLKFTWKNKTSPTTAVATGQGELQLSTQSKFEGTGIKKVSFAENAELSLALTPGKYFWRLARGTERSEIRAFQIERVKPLRARSPNATEPVNFTGGLSVVNFYWDFDESDRLEHLPGKPASHFIEISTTEYFQKVSNRLPIKPEIGFTSLKSLAPGNYFWRIQSQYHDTTVTSLTQNFELRSVKKIELGNLSPADQTSVSLKKPVLFKWTSSVPDVESIFELVEVVPGRREVSVVTENVTTSNFRWVKPKEGFFKWRVKASAANAPAVESAYRDLSVYAGDPISPLSPENGHTINFWDKPIPIAFTWANEPAIKSGTLYRLAISDAVDYSSGTLLHPTYAPLTEQTTLGSEKLAASFTTGDHYWQVSAIDSEQRIVKSSGIVKFSYLPHPLLESPAPLTPANETVIKITNPEDFPKLTWAEIPFATSYEMIWGGAEAVNKRTTVSTVKPVVALKKLRAGKYEWSVRAIDPLRRPGKTSPPQTFVIDLGPKLTAPQDIGVEVR